MTLSSAIERLVLERKCAEYSLSLNPNDEKAKTLIEAIETTRKFVDDFVCHISRYSNFDTNENKED